MTDERAAAFRVGDLVRVTPADPPHHTRAPAYVRGHIGRVRQVQRAAPLPDDLVLGADLVRACPVYTVAFRSSDLWQERGGSGHMVLCDLWETYLEPAGEPPHEKREHTCEGRSTQ